jgi:hypothetical protein
VSHRMHKIHALSQLRRVTSHIEQRSVGTRLVFVLPLGLATISAWQEEITDHCWVGTPRYVLITVGALALALSAFIGFGRNDDVRLHACALNCSASIKRDCATRRPIAAVAG